MQNTPSQSPLLPHSSRQEIPHTKKASRKKRKFWVQASAIIGTIAALIAILQFAGIANIESLFYHPTPTTPTLTTPTRGTAPAQPTIPQLNSAYVGSATANGPRLNFALTQLVEQNDGSFTANGVLGACNITVQGTVTGTEDIAFTIQPTGNCFQTGTFIGKVSNKGATLAGTWNLYSPGTSTPPVSGDWNLS